MGCDTKDHNAYASDLLLYYARAEGRTIGESRIEPETKGLEHANGWLVTHASETIRKGQPVTFVTVLVPHPRSVSGNVLADSIQVIEKDGGTEVTLSHKRDTVRVKFRQGNRQWSLARQER